MDQWGLCKVPRSLKMNLALQPSLEFLWSFIATTSRPPSMLASSWTSIRHNSARFSFHQAINFTIYRRARVIWAWIVWLSYFRTEVVVRVWRLDLAKVFYYCLPYRMVLSEMLWKLVGKRCLLLHILTIRRTTLVDMKGPSHSLPFSENTNTYSPNILARSEAGGIFL